MSDDPTPREKYEEAIAALESASVPHGTPIIAHLTDEQLAYLQQRREEAPHVDS